jgi:hypothetical protein
VSRGRSILERVFDIWNIDRSTHVLPESVRSRVPCTGCEDNFSSTLLRAVPSVSWRVVG